VRFVGGTAAVGDRIQVTWMGPNASAAWHVEAFSSAAGGVAGA
jgi:hypothetical protein